MNKESELHSCIDFLPANATCNFEPKKCNSPGNFHATNSLKALAAKVLQCNSGGNSYATDEKNLCNWHATNQRTICNSDEAKLFSGFALNELKKAAEDSWDEIKDNPAMLNAFAIALHDLKLLREGQIPSCYTSSVFCHGCKKEIPIYPINMSEVLGCPWCVNRGLGLSIPEPNKFHNK